MYSAISIVSFAGREAADDPGDVRGPMCEPAAYPVI